MIQAPIIHVNGDDPKRSRLPPEWRGEYRNLFKRDIFIDFDFLSSSWS